MREPAVQAAHPDQAIPQAVMPTQPAEIREQAVMQLPTAADVKIRHPEMMREILPETRRVIQADLETWKIPTIIINLHLYKTSEAASHLTCHELKSLQASA
jgi:hypothetical protein